MRFESIRLRNMATFDDVELDLLSIDAELIAFCGVNGSGKTTMLELLPGTPLRQCATRGTLLSNARGRDSFSEVTVCNGKRYTIRQNIDALTGKGETSIVDEAGRPVVESGKVRDADRWVAEHFPDPDVLYSSSFAVQGRQGLLDMRKSDRKQVILRALGIERLERMAELARERERGAKEHASTLRARIADLPEADIDALGAQLDQAKKDAATAVERTRAARTALERAVAAAADASRVAELAAQRRAAQARLNAAVERIAETETRLANNRAVLERREEIEAACERALTLDKLLVSARDELQDRRRDLDVARAVVTDADARLRECTNAQARAESDVARLEGRLRDREQVLAAREKLAESHDLVHACERKVAGMEAEVARLEALVVSGKDRRIGELRGTLDLVRRDAAFSADAATLGRYAEEGLTKDDDLAADLDQAPAALKAARDDLLAVRSGLEKARRDCLALERLAARATEIEQAQADLAEARIRVAKAAEAADNAGRVRADSLESESKAARAMDAADARAKGFSREREGITANLLKPRLADAEARIEELTAGLPAFQKAKTDAETELASLPPVSEAAPVDVAAQEQAVAAAEVVESATAERCTRLRTEIERAESVIAKRKALTIDLKEAESEHADWTRLVQDLGKNGLQAMEIDACLPEVNALANELLYACFGSRYTLELRTDRLSADGKKTIEDLEIRVLDSENGYDGPVEKYSGGQKVILGEALSLAITVLACQRLGIDRPTLVRDESGSALDADAARAYVAMLRKAARMIGADKVLIVSHSLEIQDMADAKVFIEGGKVRVAA
jgi:exonuclease SbcC